MASKSEPQTFYVSRVNDSNSFDLAPGTTSRPTAKKYAELLKQRAKLAAAVEKIDQQIVAL